MSIIMCGFLKRRKSIQKLNKRLEGEEVKKKGGVALKDCLRKKIKDFLIISSSLFIFVQMAPVVFAAGPIIIDHTCTDLSQIPDVWLEQAKSLTLHYAHTSHGSQVTSGISNLESQNAIYSVAIRTSTSAGLPPVENPPALRI